MNDNDDLRDIFRRAFEERESRMPPPSSGGGMPPRRSRQPNVPSLPPDWWRSRRLWAGAIIFTLLLSFNWIVTTYTEWLWFTNVDYTDIWVKTFLAKLLTFAIFFVLAFLIFSLNARIASRGRLQPAAAFPLPPLEDFEPLFYWAHLHLRFCLRVPLPHHGKRG